MALNSSELAASQHWRRTERALLIAVLVYFTGTSFVIPFLPLYVKDVGDLSVPAAAAWSGAILGVTPVVSGVVSPVWGALGDRFGHKLLLQRSLLGFAIALGAMGFAHSPVDLLIARLAMGLVGGFSVAAQSMLSMSVPKNRIMTSLGHCSAARVLGMGIGPLPGGVLADAFGFRGACLLAMGGGILAFLVVTFLAAPARREERRLHDEASASPRPHTRTSGRVRARAVLTSPPFLGALAAITVVRLVERSFDPVVPLLVAEMSGSATGSASTTALVSSSGLLATAVGASCAGAIDRGRLSKPNRLVRLLLVVSAVLAAFMFVVDAWWQLLILRSTVGLAFGLASSLAVASVALETPARLRGTSMGLIGTGIAFGAALGSLGAGLLAPVALPAVFLLDSVVLGLSVVMHLLGRRRIADAELPNERRARPCTVVEPARAESEP